jgi:hypothetical protein
LSSKGFRIVNMEKSSIVYSSLVRALNLQILRIKQRGTPRIGRSSFATLLCVAIANTKRCTLSFLVLLPITVDYLDRWAHRHQCHGHTPPWHRSTLDFRDRIHDAEIAWADLVELRAVYARFPTGSTDRYSPAAVIKWNLLPGTADTKAPFPSELGSTVLVLLLASLSTCH